MNKSHAALSSVPSGREDRLTIKSSQSNAMGTTLKTHLDQEGRKAGRLAWGELAVTAPGWIGLPDDGKVGCPRRGTSAQRTTGHEVTQSPGKHQPICVVGNWRRSKGLCTHSQGLVGSHRGACARERPSLYWQ